MSTVMSLANSAIFSGCAVIFWQGEMKNEIWKMSQEEHRSSHFLAAG
jgi:glutamate 5-kinase